MRPKIIFSFCFVLGFFPALAQEAGKLRVGVETGCLFPRALSKKLLFAGFGFCGTAEMKYNLADNMNVGLKAETAQLIKSSCCGVDLLSFFATYDYYFHHAGKRHSYFIGAGLGYLFIEAWESYKSKYSSPAFFIRSGFEFGKCRISLAYHINRNPRADKYSEIRKNDYLSLTVGFYLGGGKWK